MTVALRYIDLTFMLPKRLAFAEEVHRREREETASDADRKSIAKDGHEVETLPARQV